MYKILFLLLAVQTISPHAITYELNGGRFGDNLSTYCKAKWFCYKFGIPLLYKSFEYSNQLQLHQHEQLFTEEQTNTFDSIVKVKTVDDIIKNKQKNVLFVTNFYSQTPGLYEFGLQNPAFSEHIKTMLTPLCPPTLSKETNTITVALHVRKGGGFDSQSAYQTWPTKFPANSYYIEQLKLIRNLIDKSFLLVIHLFTDDPNPEALVQKYRNALNDSSITFSYRTENNSHKANVVEDFYSMAQCDCLIRSSSLFAKAAQLLGDFKIMIYPVQGYWDKKLETVIIDPVGVYIKK